MKKRLSFFARLRIAWRILWAKGPVFTAPPTEIVNAAHAVSPKLSPYRLSIQWWCPLEREAWAREHLARELAGDAEQFVRFYVEQDEETQSCTVRGELWVLTENADGKTENQS